MNKQAHHALRQNLKTKIRDAKDRGRKLKLRRPHKPQRPLNIQKKYTAELNKMVLFLHEIYRKEVFPKLKGIVDKAQAHRPKKKNDDVKARYLSDDYSDDVDYMMHNVKIQYQTVASKPIIASTASNIGKEVNNFSKAQTQKQIKSLVGVDVFSSEPWLGTEMKAFTKINVDLISKWTDAQHAQAHEIIMRGAMNGTEPSAIAKELSSRIDVMGSRYDMIARDQVNKFNSALNMIRQTDLGIERYTWDTCVLPDTRVVAFNPKKLMRREYVGTIIEVTSKSGFAFSVTPNHKVLTSRGWVRADGLKDGDDLVRYIPEIERSSSGMPNINNVPPKIEEAFASSYQSANQHGVVRIIPNLDSEGIKRYIEVVPIDGHLLDRVEAICPKGIGKFLLKLTDFDFKFLLPNSMTVSNFWRMLSSPVGYRHFFYSFISIFCRFFGGSKNSCFGKTPESFPHFSQGGADGDLSASKVNSELISRKAVAIHFCHEKLVGLSFKEWSGHVYDMNTAGGWMIANSFVVHNSHDERVRPMHADLDGQVFSYDQPPVTNEDGDENNPGDDYNCRCSALANLDDLVGEISDEIDEEDQADFDAEQEEGDDETIFPAPDDQDL